MSERKLTRPRRLHPRSAPYHPRPYYKASAGQLLCRLDLSKEQIERGANAIESTGEQVDAHNGQALADILKHIAQRLRCAE